MCSVRNFYCMTNIKGKGVTCCHPVKNKVERADPEISKYMSDICMIQF
jgi:hypothetical protein